jgi:hypothetical protein
MSIARVWDLFGKEKSEYAALSDGTKEAAAAKSAQRVHAEQQARILQQMQQGLLNAESTFTNLTTAMNMILATAPIQHIQISSLVFRQSPAHLKTAYDEMTDEKNATLFQGYKAFHACLMKIIKHQEDIEIYLNKGEPKLDNAKLRSDHAKLTSNYNEFKKKNSELIETYKGYDRMVKAVIEHVEEQQNLQICYTPS